MPCGPYPCGCCVHCTDYYDPDEWYALFCHLSKNADGYANRITIGGQAYFWGSHTLDSAINNLLVNWQFDLSQPSYAVGAASVYQSPLISVPSIDQTATIYWGNPAFPEGAYASLAVTFANSEVQVEVLDNCGQRYARAKIYCDVSESSGAWSSPSKYANPLIAIEYGGSHVVEACGSIMQEQKFSTLSNFTSPYHPTESFVPPIKYLSTTSRKLIVAPTPPADCSDY